MKLIPLTLLAFGLPLFASARTTLNATGRVIFVDSQEPFATVGDTVTVQISYNENARKHYVDPFGTGAIYCEGLGLEMTYSINGHTWQAVQDSCVYDSVIGAGPHPRAVISWDEYNYMIYLTNGYPDPDNGGAFPRFPNPHPLFDQGMILVLTEFLFGDSFIGNEESILTEDNSILGKIGSSYGAILGTTFFRIDFELMTLSVSTVSDTLVSPTITALTREGDEISISWNGAAGESFELQEWASPEGWTSVRPLTTNESPVRVALSPGTKLFRIVQH